MLFRDDLFNGDRIKLHLKTPEGINRGTGKGAHFILKSVTKEYYEYATTLKLQYKIAGDPLAQPVSVKTNVKNGLGLISSFSATSVVYLYPEAKMLSFSPTEGRPGDIVTIEGENLFSDISDTRVFFGTKPFNIFNPGTGEGLAQENNF